MTGLWWEAESPAKVNLGLEVLGKRDDGFHEIRSVLSAISLSDHLSLCLHPSNEADRVEIDSGLALVPDLTSNNLVERAIQVFREHVTTLHAVEITLSKRIPLAAGLGGASSNAATTLRLLNAAMSQPFGSGELHDLAASLGSDVPFFLGSATALVSGTGTELHSLPGPRGSLVLVTPPFSIPGKTATLYATLSSEDWTEGSRTDDICKRLKSQLPVEKHMLANAFSRALESIAPEIVETRQAMVDVGCDGVALSGAGPTHYAIVESPEQATAIAQRLAADPRTAGSAIHTAQFVDRHPDISGRAV